MKLIIIYGPPAVGKLTVAKELAERTGYKLFHNHLSRDVVKSLFPSNHPRFTALVEKIRLELIEEAAKENIDGIIFTFVYDPQEDDEFLSKVNAICDKYRAEFYYIQLKTDIDTLKERVAEESRQSHSKISSVEKLQNALSGYSWSEAVPFDKNFAIDNTKIPPAEVVQEIMSFVSRS